MFPLYAPTLIEIDRIVQAGSRKEPKLAKPLERAGVILGRGDLLYTSGEGWSCNSQGRPQTAPFLLVHPRRTHNTGPSQYVRRAYGLGSSGALADPTRNCDDLVDQIHIDIQIPGRHLLLLQSDVTIDPASIEILGNGVPYLWFQPPYLF